MDAGDTVVQVERVCCLECGTNYIKPSEGSTAYCNPGCPSCGYVGWISAVVPTTDATTRTPRRRSGAGPRPSPAARQR